MEQEGNNNGDPLRLPETTKELRSSFQIRDGPVVYSQSTHLSTTRSDLTVLVGNTGAQGSRTGWLSHIDRLVVATAESNKGI